MAEKDMADFLKKHKTETADDEADSSEQPCVKTAEDKADLPEQHSDKTVEDKAALPEQHCEKTSEDKADLPKQHSEKNSEDKADLPEQHSDKTADDKADFPEQHSEKYSVVKVGLPEQHGDKTAEDKADLAEQHIEKPAEDKADLPEQHSAETAEGKTDLQKQPRKKTAEDYAYEAMAADRDGSIVYKRGEDLEAWLNEFAPSKVSRHAGVGWIAMEGDGIVDDSVLNFGDLQKEWQELKDSGNPINFFTISELAKRNGIVGGGWLFHVNSGHLVDFLWGKVARAFVQGTLSDIATKVRVSPTNPDDDSRTHVIVVKHRDFTNEDEVYGLNEALRSTGIKTKLMYKPDVYTHLGIYRNNEYKIKPTIYTSTYDVLKKVSKIQREYERVGAEA